MRKPSEKLARGLIRMSWSKKNLFIMHLRGNAPPRMQNKSLFQQKWQAKKDTRGYHGAQLNERQFLKSFSTRLPTSNMRVAGQDTEKKYPPLAVNTFACLERRLDFIVFRSCFAPSIWAARQMVVHGKVSVNGKKVSAPSHLAQDGDIISVKPSAISFLHEADPPNDNVPFVFKPKPFMQPFLFIPEYLEVNFNACSVVYLRDPISRPGKSEIPSPYPPETHALAREFYVGLKRKRKDRYNRWKRPF
ncbi:7192_t:CDS:2 [Ambispora gerdemannii]|uniref:7192_t:CDS:1 n=1 Tax=Ambispora gerdemannii TaxID=144530 RepID=A0A9N8ZWX4_9GLOM|nr:7192_t:CDS:2 [Ambispora gerdemannii]